MNTTIKKNYNKIPIIVCSKCLSPAIKCEDAVTPWEEGTYTDEYKYCADCGNVSTMILTLATWEKKYQAMYGLKYLENSDGSTKD